MDLHLLYVIDSLARAGAEQSLASMAPYWVQAGVRLDVAYFHERQGLHAELGAAGARLFPLGATGGRWDWGRRLSGLVAKEQPELIHSTLFESDLAARFASYATKTVTVSSLVNLAYGPEQRRNAPLGWQARLLAAQLADAASARLVRRFHAISSEVAAVMSRRLRVSTDRIDVIPRGRDPGTMGSRTPERRRAARAVLGIPDSSPLVFAGARQEHQKGLDVLLKAYLRVVAELPTARLVIAGRPGNATESLRALAASAGMEEVFIGMRSDIPDLLCAADVWVEPSRWEGGPGAMLEAMALEAPIVASDLPVYRGAVEAGVSALLAPVGDAEALAAAIIRTIDEPEATRERTRAAKYRFHEAFTVAKVSAQILDFYDRALNKRVVSDGPSHEPPSAGLH